MSAADRAEPERDAACAEARAAILAYTEGAIERAAERALRSHLCRCDPCRAYHRESLEHAARLGRALREGRAGRAGRLALGSRGPRGRRSSRRGIREALLWLRPVLIPAFFFYLILQVTGLRTPASKVWAHWAHGEVEAARWPLGEAAPRAAMTRGDWCIVGAGSAAELEVARTRVLVGERSTVLVEDPEAPRFLLREGDLDVRGPCALVTPSGVLSIEGGEARVRLRDAVLEVEVVTGAASLVGPLGSIAIGPGESRALGLPGS